MGNYGIDSLWYLLVEPATPTPTPTLTPTDTPTPTPTTQVRWHTGNRRSDAYGVKANIWAPAQAPVLQESGESNWVSLPQYDPPGITDPPYYWLQTGWRYYPWYLGVAKQYVEAKSPIEEDQNYDTHNWGEIVDYMVFWSSGSHWCAAIDGELKGCYLDVMPAPVQVQAMSEVHDNPANQLDTRFSAVYYLDSNIIWQLFDQAIWEEDAPYSVQKDEYYYFRNYGP